ncbi:phage minor structural protein [Enterococcus hirae EnGen0127]|uniref:phage tail protein n=2 Tax=Enterococcus hirae TaxID=1354 RepID=UPI000330FF78|nr:phage tail protein [Enterococcus hirae]EOF59544.1 phage minor structural protein [Enterococcus hirae EnGen0127]MCC1500944.1 phage tail protein [Enterococcus hirae]
MDDIIVRNYEQTKEEILVRYDKDSFYEDWQQNETWEIGLSVTSLINQEVFDLIEYESSIIFNGQEFIIKKMTENVVGGLVTKQVVATHIYYTIQDGYQYEKVTGTKSINQLLTHIFKAGNRGFTWEVIDPNKKFLTVQQENFGDGNYLKLINELLSDYNAVVIPNNKHLMFYPISEYGRKVEEQIRYKYNTDEVTFDIDTYSLKTQIKGYGKLKEGINTENPKDSDYVFTPITYTSPESKTWGIRIQDPVTDERYTISGNMLERLKNDLQDYPSISGSVTLKWKINPQKGDYVPFIYEPLNINTYIQVVGIKTYPAIPNKPPEITLSNTKKTMTAILANMVKKGVV